MVLKGEEEMVKVEKRIKVHKDSKVLEALALFDTGSRRSYFSKEFAEKIGYEPYRETKEVPLAVRGKYGKLVGDTTVYIEGGVYPAREGNNWSYRRLGGRCNNRIEHHGKLRNLY